MAESLSNLESNDPRLVEETKQKLHEQLNGIKEPWLINGLYDAYLSSNSTRLIEILVNVKEPHYSFLFDRISESIRSSKDNMKIQGLSLLGHIVKSEPAWIYKITNHNLMKDLLKLLKHETEIIALITALMALIALIPSIPSQMKEFLADVFDIFGRLASWNCDQTGKIHEEQMAHMQITLYSFFLRLYGMYPCNFVAYLRDQYRNKNLTPIFCHTIKPMLERVKMHPHLVTTSTYNETSTERWKKMAAHDVTVECEGYSLDLPDRCTYDQCVLSTPRPKSTTSILNSDNPCQLDSLKVISAQRAVAQDGDFFSPSMILHCPTPPVTEKSLPTNIPFAQMQSNVQTTLISSVTQITQESSSPPEAAIEATPETTPVRDNRMNIRVPPPNSTIAKAHTFATRIVPLNSGQNTPINSQPSSPMRKEMTSFTFQDIPRHSSTFASIKRESGGRLQKLIQDRTQMGDGRSPFVVVPTSPSRGVLSSETSAPGSPIPMQRLESPFSQEDEEVSQIVRHGETVQHPGVRQCDSVLHEVEGFRGNDDDVDTCEQEHGSPCTEGGLHMPNSKSITDLTIRMRRLRYHSQCAEDRETRYETSTGSSPGNSVSHPANNISVRRAKSLPDMEKSPILPPPGKDTMNTKTLLEADEDGGADVQELNSRPYTNGIDAKRQAPTTTRWSTAETQTENIWPMPYDHLFPIIFPALGNSTDAASLVRKQEGGKCRCDSIYEISDKYIDLSHHASEKDAVNNLRTQVELLRLQLQFEKHRKDMHALKNRRLIADAKNTKALEEHKDALMDTVRIKQGDVDSLKEMLEVVRKEKICMEKEALDNGTLWEKQYKILQNECKKLKDENEDFRREVGHLREENAKLKLKWQEAESNLLNALVEVKIAKEQAEAGERGKIELEHVNKELLLVGELQLKYQERLNALEMLRTEDVEQKRLIEAYRHDIQELSVKVETMKRNQEAYATRISDLEGIIQKHDEADVLQKRQLNDVKGECHEKLKAVESKYRTQLSCNRCLEEKIVDLCRHIETLSKKVISPDVSSCHEVNATLTDRTSAAQGLSSQSSPLSASLASSEGSMASTISEMKNLQRIIDQNDDNE